MQATYRGRRKKAVRQGVQIISVLSITARLLLRMFYSPRPGPSYLADKRDIDGGSERTASEVSCHCLR
jgi:hypothetical protein